MPSTSFVNWYLPIRKLISSVSTVAQYRASEISPTIAALRKIDYSDPRLYKSGLLRDAIESHFWLLENRGGLSLDSIFNDMNISANLILNNIAKNELLYNDVTKYLFDYFEKHSLFQASEYLALKALNQKNVTLNANLSNVVWSNNASTPSITVNQSGSFIAITINNGCASPPSNQISVVVNPLPQIPIISATGPTTFCSGTSVILNSSL